ncbi:MAG: hypothetical protein M1821_001158 [Bathelium mastoideum]|nr:MAG: hypothetical protein M1821_001158 [Bathelium mastoideum]
METGDSSLPVTLLDLLSNSLVLHQTAPYLSIAATLNLGATSKAFRSLIYNSPDTFRYADLSLIKSANVPYAPADIGGINWRSQRMDEALTEDDFYCGPLRGIFSKLGRARVLGFVHILILDGLTVPADLVREIVAEDRFNVRILSIREVKHLNERKLRQVLEYAVRPTRAEGTPKLKGLYYFGPRDSPSKDSWAPRVPMPGRSNLKISSAGVMGSEGAQIGAEWNQRSLEALTTAVPAQSDEWYSSSGRMIKRASCSDWAETLRACEGIIAFDAVLCRGPRHDPRALLRGSSGNPEAAFGKVMSYLKPEVASVALGPVGCTSCGDAPEEPAIFGSSSADKLPLLSPPPIHSPTIRSAQRPFIGQNCQLPKLTVRCEECLQGRWCERCNVWWCENCYREPASRLKAMAEQGTDQNQPGASENALGKSGEKIKVHLGLCVEHCLVGEMMSGAGSNGMWA